MTYNKSESEQPTIVRLIDPKNTGIEAMTLTRYAIGFIVRGTANVYDGDRCHRLSRGDVFYLGLGNHYVEKIPENGKPFEQILIYYTPEDLRRILLQLSIAYGFRVSNSHVCDRCRTGSHISMPAWDSLRALFLSTNDLLMQEERQGNAGIAEEIRISEIFFQIASHADCCLKNKLLSNIDAVKENFEQVICNHIFQDVSIEELAGMCNRSLTSFKKEFRRRFGYPPHKWIIRQRMMHARLLLISTEKSISEIGYECTFTNTSHFIKLFKKEYGLTPAAYRARSNRSIAAPARPHAATAATAAAELEQIATAG